MSKYINYEDLTRKAKYLPISAIDDTFITTSDINSITDIVNIVRCKDCIYATERYGHIECINGISYRNTWNKPDDFCNYGKGTE